MPASPSTNLSTRELQLLGDERSPLLILDDFFPHPEQLLQQAEEGAPFAAQTSDYYPGLRKPASADYSTFVQAQLPALLQELLRDYFAPPGAAQPRISLCAFSLTTTAQHQLHPMQCVPHVDAQDEQQFALVHYLCGSEFGGTGFYRHRASGFERITSARLGQYFPQLQQQLRAQGRSLAGYMRGSNELFEQIGAVEARFNRAILYPGNLLHSGLINASQGLPRDPRRGRLTLNSFIRCDN